VGVCQLTCRMRSPGGRGARGDGKSGRSETFRPPCGRLGGGRWPRAACCGRFSAAPWREEQNRRARRAPTIDWRSARDTTASLANRPSIDSPSSPPAARGPEVLFRDTRADTFRPNSASARRWTADAESPGRKRKRSCGRQSEAWKRVINENFYCWAV